MRLASRLVLPPSCRAPAPAPPSCTYKLYSRGAQARFIRMKSTSRKRSPSIVNLTVRGRYLTQREIERLMDCARKHGRYGHRDATMILVAYRHGLRASEVCDLQWQQIELSEGRLQGVEPLCRFEQVTRGVPPGGEGSLTPPRDYPAAQVGVFLRSEPQLAPPQQPHRRARRVVRARQVGFPRP